MADRRYTYTVEIDTASLAAAEQQIRQRLGGAMAQIAAPASMPQATQQAARAASELDRELQKIANLDLTGGIEKMEKALQSLRAEARRLDGDLQSAHMTQSTGFASGVKGRTAFSDGERRAIIENEARLYATQQTAARAERELLQEQIRHWERIAQQSADEDDVLAAMTMLEAAYEEAGDATERLLLAEREAAEALADAKRRLAQQAEDIADEAQRAQIRGGDLSTAAGYQSGGRGNAAVYLTVTQPTVTKAGELAKNIERMAEADQRRAEMLERQAAAENRRTEEIKKAIQAQAALERVTREQERQNNLALAHERTAQQLSRERATSMQAANSAARQGAIEAQKALEIERQKTVQIRAQTREQERQAAEARRSAAVTRQQFDPNAAARGLIMGGLGALGIYGGFEAIGGAYRAGRSGAQDIRMLETYQQLAESVGASAEGMQQRIADASRGTVDSMTAIRLASQVMAQRFASDLEDMEGDTEILVRFARRASQIYVDETGRMMSSQEIFARLLKFMREGNKELVDQFGLSNQLIAQTLGISVDGLASADGAAKRWAGTIQLLGEELDRLGDAQDSVADRFERSEARITNAWNRLKAASADPIAFVLEVTAATTEGVAAAGQDLARELTQTTYDPLRRQRGAAQREAVSLTALGLVGSQEWEEATRRAREYNEQIRRVQGAEIITGANITARTDKGPERTAEMERLQRAVTEIANTYTAIQMQGEIGLIDDAQIARAVSELNKLTDDMVAGKNSTADTAKAAADLRDNLSAAASVFGFMIPQAADLADELQRAVSITGGRALGLSQFQLDYRMREDPLDAFVKESREARKEENKARLEQIDRESKAAAREWESAAKRAQSAWESAAKEAQNAFKSALGNIPGMPGSGASQVTAEDMLLSRYGLYQNNADEFLRRAKDELITYTRTVGADGRETITPIPGKSPVDYAEVDAGDIARRLGVSGDLPPDILYTLLERNWTSGRLFAGGANLDLLDPGAIARQMGEQRQGQQGQDAVRTYLAQLGLAAPYDIGAEFGPQITSDMAGNIATAFPEAIAGQDIAGPAITAISAQFTADTALGQWRDMGRAGGAEFVAGAVAAVGGTNFVGQIRDAIKADIMAEIAGMLDSN